MKRLVSVFLIVTVMMSVFVVSSVSTAAASNSETVAVTHAGMEKNGYVNVSWRALSYCKYYRVFYKINNTGWVKASDVYYTSQGNYYPGQVMKKSFSVPLYRISSGNANTNVKIYVTVRGMDRNKQYNTSFRSYQVCSNQLQAFAPRMYLSSVESARATFTINDPSIIDNSYKFRVYYWNGKTWKANVFCASCGSRMSVTSHIESYRTADGEIHYAKERTTRYMCTGKTLKRKSCNGQGTYSAKVVDEIVKGFMKECFDYIRSTPQDVALETKYKAVLAELRRQIKQQEGRIVELRESQEVLSAEIAKTLLGKSIYSSEDLAAAIEKAKVDLDEAVRKLDELRNREAEKKKAYSELGKDYREFLGWADEFENATLEAQRMIVNKLVKEITLAKGVNGNYDIKVLLRSSYAQFFDTELCAIA